jgi:predicted DNA-binding transcriptional regulator AlpA
MSAMLGYGRLGKTKIIRNILSDSAFSPGAAERLSKGLQADGCALFPNRPDLWKDSRKRTSIDSSQLHDIANACERIMNEKALSIHDVAEYFNVSTRTIREWMKKDESFPRPFKKFNTLRFEQSKVEQYWAINTMNGYGE